jgi:hypothetical protein
MRNMHVRALAATIVVVYLVFAPAVAQAYDETNLGGTRSCVECHGRDGDVSDDTVSTGRRGPHGGYTTGTQKCQTCHTTHGAGTSSIALLETTALDGWVPFTVSSTCLTCHDGTGGSGVYGTILARTGVDPNDPNAPTSVHRIDRGEYGIGVVVPAGNSTGETETVQFSGWDGGLSCADCHSPHDSNTVEPFIGDRLRSESDTSSAQATSRLLKQKPGRSSVAVEYYGTEWCISCHEGMHTEGENVSGLDGNHPVAYLSDASGPWHYGRVERLDDTGQARDTEPGPLGGSNRGYILPKNEPTRTQPGPICQQCHEDSRSVGNITPFQLDETESFVASVDGLTAGNPQYQNFPHETIGRRFLIEEAPAYLCGNCHE